jgi:hypothetical protein
MRTTLAQTLPTLPKLMEEGLEKDLDNLFKADHNNLSDQVKAKMDRLQKWTSFGRGRMCLLVSMQR